MSEHWARHQQLTEHQAFAWAEQVYAKWDADDLLPPLYELPKWFRDAILRPWKKNRDRYNIFKLMVRNGVDVDSASYWALTYRTPQGTISVRTDGKATRHTTQMSTQWTQSDIAMTSGRVYDVYEKRPLPFT